jgi:hypothetical protein
MQRMGRLLLSVTLVDSETVGGGESPSVVWVALGGCTESEAWKREALL